MFMFFLCEFSFSIGNGFQVHFSTEFISGAEFTYQNVGFVCFAWIITLARLRWGKSFSSRAIEVLDTWNAKGKKNQKRLNVFWLRIIIIVVYANASPSIEKENAHGEKLTAFVEIMEFAKKKFHSSNRFAVWKLKTISNYYFHL